LDATAWFWIVALGVAAGSIVELEKAIRSRARRAAS